jgi:uncharacterized alpha/beta hydrolase family protein
MAALYLQQSLSQQQNQMPTPVTTHYGGGGGNQSLNIMINQFSP